MLKHIRDKLRNYMHNERPTEVLVLYTCNLSNKQRAPFLQILHVIYMWKPSRADHSGLLTFSCKWTCLANSPRQKYRVLNPFDKVSATLVDMREMGKHRHATRNHLKKGTHTENEAAECTFVICLMQLPIVHLKPCKAGKTKMLPSRTRTSIYKV
jgi:hypothetical protein